MKRIVVRIATLFGAWCLVNAAVAGLAASMGEQLYYGQAPAKAQLRGDSRALPPSAVVCANCHEPAAGRANFGPRLDAGLAQAVARRGGPPKEFDAASLCHMLRTGIDPAQILIRRSMPVYELTAAECAGLWQYLLQRPASGSQTP